MPEKTYNLYPEIQPFQSGWYAADEHEIYYEQCGNPTGQPIVFLHGGPGSGCNPTQRRFFDPEHYHIILLDQRGCGRSKPQGCIANNTIDHLVADLETLRTLLNIERWTVFGGSWGSTLAIAYASAFPSRVVGLILRGIFLSRDSELRWFLHDVTHFFPEAFEKLMSFLPASERGDLLHAYQTRIFSSDEEISAAAATTWNAYESSIMSLLPPAGTSTANAAPKSNQAADETTDAAQQQLQKKIPDKLQDKAQDKIQVARARVQLHYILNSCFVAERSLLEDARLLKHIPTVIVQGRYDMVCPPVSAWELSKSMPDAELHMVADAGHSAMEPGTTSALIAATEKFKTLHEFKTLNRKPGK